MKYVGIYWTLFAPLMKKSIAKRFDRDLAQQAIHRGKEEYRRLLSRADDLGPGNPMAMNAYFAYVFAGAWLGSGKKITPDEMALVILFRKSFRDRLVSVLGFTEAEAAQTVAIAKPKYREIIGKLPEFEKTDRFKMNIVNCAMLSAFVLSMKKKPSVEKLTDYYAKSMMTGPMRWFCRMSGKRKFSDKDVRSMKATAALNAADRNPYSWSMEFLPYSDGSGYEARFTRCGICTLMKELGLHDLVPAMCHLDYTMAEAGGASDFVREYTLASGGPYCDCGYKKKTLPSLFRAGL